MELENKVAFITGAARGQGRSHAVLLAEAGADIVGLDICAQIDTVGYPMATREDLDETVRLVEKTGRRMVGIVGDVRQRAALDDAVAAARREFGTIDIVIANAGIMDFQLPPYSRSEQAWHDSLDVMLTGVWHTLQATVPVMIQADAGGAIVIISSTAGTRVTTTTFDGGVDGYNAAKHGLQGLMRSYAGRLARHSIRVNTVHPTACATPMIENDFFDRWVADHQDVLAAFSKALPIGSIDPIDVSRAVLYLVSESGRYVTGHSLHVDAGQTTVASAGTVAPS
jgi:SDR family mycofactocin-dependent oxidoreductase